MLRGWLVRVGSASGTGCSPKQKKQVVHATAESAGPRTRTAWSHHFRDRRPMSDEEEPEVLDQKAVADAKCAKSVEVAKLYVEYEACSKRIEAKGHGECTGYYQDYLGAIDKCVRRAPIAPGPCPCLRLRKPLLSCAARALRVLPRPRMRSLPVSSDAALAQPRGQMGIRRRTPSSFARRVARRGTFARTGTTG